MGTRPHAYLICGIDNLECDKYGYITDPRYKMRDDWPEPDIPSPWDEVPVPVPDGAVDWQRVKTDHAYWRGVERGAAIRNYLIKAEADRTFPPREGQEVLVHNGEYGLGNVIGFIREELGTHPMLYAMTTVFEQLRGNALLPVPSLSLSDDYEAGPLRRLLQDVHAEADVEDILRRATEIGSMKIQSEAWASLDKLLAIRHGQNPYAYSREMPGMVATTKWLFDWIGLTVPPEEYRLYFYWRWT